MPTRTRSREGTRRRNPSSRERRSFNRREAAYFADVSVRQVNKAIEEKVLRPWRPDTNRVYLEWDDVVTLALIAKTPLKLSRQTKKQIHNWVKASRASDLRSGELPLSDILVLRLNSDIAAMASRLDAYRETRERHITVDPEIQGGEPVISGTRLPVASVAERLTRGDSLADLVDDYPGIPEPAFEAARIYAAAHPRRGRPVRPWREG